MSHHFICGKGTGPVFLSQCVIAETLTYRKIEHLLKKVNVWLFSGESIVTYEIVPIFAMSSKAEPIGLGLKGE